MSLSRPPEKIINVLFGTVWKRPDEEKLLKYIKEGRDYPYIAEKLGRTARSCGVHWQKHVSHWPEARNVVYNPSMTVNGVNLRMYRNRPA